MGHYYEGDNQKEMLNKGHELSLFINVVNVCSFRILKERK